MPVDASDLGVEAEYIILQEYLYRKPAIFPQNVMLRLPCTTITLTHLFFLSQREEDMLAILPALLIAGVAGSDIALTGSAGIGLEIGTITNTDDGYGYLTSSAVSTSILSAPAVSTTLLSASLSTTTRTYTVTVNSPCTTPGAK
ncbi:hypothetical protein F4782DRAFT_309478 [Xylaria castorea]|nr:hypothetical protein F4782DRAFT_309478 [Xylaria castorea]